MFRQARAQGQGIDANPVRVHKRVETDVKCVCLALQFLECGRDILPSSDFQRKDINPKRTGGYLGLIQLQYSIGTVGIAMIASRRRSGMTSRRSSGRLGLRGPADVRRSAS